MQPRDGDELLSDVGYVPADSVQYEGIGSLSRCPGPPTGLSLVRSFTPGLPNLCEVSLEFVNDVFSQRCFPCHTSSSSGGHSIGSSNIDAAYSDALVPSYGDALLTKAEQSLIRAQNGTMPNPNSACTGDPLLDLGGAKCFTLVEQGALLQWIVAGPLPPTTP